MNAFKQLVRTAILSACGAVVGYAAGVQFSELWISHLVACFAGLIAGAILSGPKKTWQSSREYCKIVSGKSRLVITNFWMGIRLEYLKTRRKYLPIIRNLKETFWLRTYLFWLFLIRFVSFIAMAAFTIVGLFFGLFALSHISYQGRSGSWFPNLTQDIFMGWIEASLGFTALIVLILFIPTVLTFLLARKWTCIRWLFEVRQESRRQVFTSFLVLFQLVVLMMPGVSFIVLTALILIFGGGLLVWILGRTAQDDYRLHVIVASAVGALIGIHFHQVLVAAAAGALVGAGLNFIGFYARKCEKYLVKAGKNMYRWPWLHLKAAIKIYLA